MEKIKTSMKVAALTKEKLKRRMNVVKPGWIDIIDPIEPQIIKHITSMETSFVVEHALRCPANNPRISRNWSQPGIPRNIRGNQQLRNRFSPISYHTYENRFGRFEEKTSSSDTRRIWASLSALKLPTQALLYAEAVNCLDEFTRIVNLPQCPRRSRRKRF
uniref:Rga2 protein n=1 Tax=Ustilago esculenta TaxID=185366 RepID=A0A481SMN7_9BASI|nr:rga2 protein [Ustilago esculenta]